MLSCIGEVAYKLKLPKGSRIHHVFHVLVLKKTLGSRVEIQTNVSDGFHAQEEVHVV